MGHSGLLPPSRRAGDEEEEWEEEEEEEQEKQEEEEQEEEEEREGWMMVSGREHFEVNIEAMVEDRTGMEEVEDPLPSTKRALHFYHCSLQAEGPIPISYFLASYIPLSVTLEQQPERATQKPHRARRNPITLQGM